MTAKIIRKRSKRQFVYSRAMRKMQRGQSLAEVALSLTFLMLAFSGTIDLGRALFTRITMDTAVSEGAHWTAAYPGCFLYGAAFGDMSNVINAPPACAGTNSIAQRMRNESSLLAPSLVQATYLSTPGGEPAYKVKPGDTVTIGLTYNMPLLTPVMQALFGQNLSLTVEAKEVIRGTTLPITTGLPSTYTATNYPPMPTNLTQIYSDNSAACDHGYAPVSWKEPAAKTVPTTSTPTTFEVWVIDGGTAMQIDATNPVLPNPNAYLDSWAATGVTGHQFYSFHEGTTNPGGVPTSLQIDLTTGGAIMYGIRTKDQLGKYSDFEYILLTCTLVQPKTLAYTCAAQVGTPLSSPSATFTWSMPNTTAYSWSPSQPFDKSVDGYRIIRTSDNTAMTVSPAISPGQSTATTTTLTFGASTDPNRTNTYYMVAVDNSGNPVGLDNSGNALTNSGGVYSGHTLSTNDLPISCP